MNSAAGAHTEARRLAPQPAGPALCNQQCLHHSLMALHCAASSASTVHAQSPIDVTSSGLRPENGRLAKQVPQVLAPMLHASTRPNIDDYATLMLDAPSSNGTEVVLQRSHLPYWSQAGSNQLHAAALA